MENVRVTSGGLRCYPHTDELPFCCWGPLVQNELPFCRRGPLVQDIEQAHRPHSGAEWHFTCSMRSKWRHRAGKSAPQPLRTTLALLDELHEELSQGRHLPCSMNCTKDTAITIHKRVTKTATFSRKCLQNSSNFCKKVFHFTDNLYLYESCH